MTTPNLKTLYGSQLTGILNPTGQAGSAAWQPTPILNASSADLTNPNNLLQSALNNTIDWSQVGSNMAATQTGVPNIPQSPVTGIRNDASITEHARIAAQKTSQEYTREDLFSIGTVYLSIPPSQIGISEEKHNFRFKTLRGGSDIVVTSGRSTIRIDLEILFNGLDDINNKLRPLLAQFKCTPFLPINNDYVRSVIEPESVDTGDNNAQAAVNEADQVNSLQSNKTSSINNLISQVQSLQSMGALSVLQTGNVINLINQWYGAGNSLAPSLLGAGSFTSTSLTDGSLTLDIKGYISSLVVTSGSQIDNDQITNYAPIMNNIGALGNAINNYSVSSIGIVNGNITQRYVNRQIVGALSQITISTMPGYPETLNARISMYVFNYYPYSFDFSFIKGYEPNSYTPDITQCDLFIDWYSNRFLSLLGQGVSLGEYSNNENLEFLYIDQFSYDQLITDNPPNYTPKKLIIGGGYEPKSFVTGISVTMRNVIKFMPILSDAQPTCQYLGAYNTSVQININSTDKKDVSRIKKMLNTMANTSRRANRLTRYFLFHVNNVLLNLCGLNYCIVDVFSVDTVPGNPGLYSISIELTEAKLNQEKLEQLNRILTTDDPNIQAAAQHIVEMASLYAQDTSPFHRNTAQYSPYYSMCFNNQNASSTNSTSFIQNSPLYDSIMTTVNSGSVGASSGYSPQNSNTAFMNREIKKILNGVPSMGGSSGTWGSNGILQGVQDEWQKIMSNTKKAMSQTTEAPATGVEAYFKNFLIMFNNNLATPLWAGTPMNWATESIFAATCFAHANKSTIASMIDPESIGAPELQNYISEQAVKSQGNPKNLMESTCYPDLALPRYIDLPDKSSFKLTYRDLGLLPFNQTMSTWPAQTDYASVEPDIFYRKQSIDTLLDNVGMPGMEAGLSNFNVLTQINLNGYSNAIDYPDFIEKAVKASNYTDPSYGVPNSVSSQLISQAMGNNTTVNGAQNSNASQIQSGTLSQSSSNSNQINGKPCTVTGVLDASTFLVKSSSGATYAIRSIDYFPAPDGNGNSMAQSSSPNAVIAYNVLNGKTITPQIMNMKVTYQYGYYILNASLNSNDSNGNLQDIASLMTNAGMVMDQGSNALQSSTYGNTTGAVPSENSAQDLSNNFQENTYSIITSTKNPVQNTLPNTDDTTVPSASSVVGANDNEVSQVNVQGQNAVAGANGTVPIISSRFYAPLQQELLYSQAPDQVNNNGNYNRFDRYSSDHIADILTRIRYQSKDDLLRMVKAFPTFKFYFVEETRGEYVPIPFMTTQIQNPNELYSYNAIISIDINRSRKEAADTAIVRILNTKGILDRSRFGLHDPTTGNQQEGTRNSPNPDNDNTVNQMETIDEFILKTGTRIKITLGYGSDPIFLENVFTGQVSEVDMGDVITIIAQGYGTELMKPLVGWAAGKQDTYSTYKILNNLVQRDEVEHFGFAEWNPIANSSQVQLYQRQYPIIGPTPQGSIVRWGQPNWFREWASVIYLLERGSKNTDNNLWEPAHDKSSEFVFGTGFEFQVGNRNTWEIFQEMVVRYAMFQHMIAQVLPFDDRATIYFGPKDWYYSYSENIRALLGINETTLQDTQGQVDSAVNNESISPLTDDQVLSECNQVNSLVIRNYTSSDSQYLSYGFSPYPSAYLTLQHTAIAIAPQNNSYNSSLINSFMNIAGNQSDVSSPGIVVGNYYFIPGSSVQALSSVNSSNQTPQATNPLYQTNDGVYVDKNTYVKNLAKMGTSAVPGDRKLIRSYHYYDSFRNIVANGIQASSENMWNKATVMSDLKCDMFGRMFVPHVASGDHYISATANDGIWQGKIKELIFNEPNAVTQAISKSYALGHLGHGMNEMYTGSLTILGDATVKPNDVVFIDDYFTDMHGPFEVREVNHHFSHDTGFVTNIVPDLMVYTNNSMAIGADSLAGGYFDDLANIVLMGRPNLRVSPNNKITNGTAAGLGNNPAYSTPTLNGSFSTQDNASNNSFYGLRPYNIRQATAQSALTKILNGNLNTTIAQPGSTSNQLWEVWKEGEVFQFRINPLINWIPNNINSLICSMQFFVGGFTMAMREPINFCPLIYSNHPYIAGIEGWRRIDWWEAALKGPKRLLYNVIMGTERMERIFGKARKTGVTT